MRGYAGILKNLIGLAPAAALVLLAASGAARSAMHSAGYSVEFSRVVGVGGRFTSGGTEFSHIFGESVGLQTLSGGVFTVNPGQTILGVPKATLAGAYCYPSPFIPAQGHTTLTFKNLTGHVSLRVFDLSGGLVYETERDAPAGELEWEVVNFNKSRLASGVYIFLITSGGEKMTGRFSVIR